MSMNDSIINLINQNKSLKEICKELNISEKQFYLRIKRIISDGNLLDPCYCYDSNIYYNKANKLDEKQKNSISISLPSKDTDFKFIVISDLHIGNKKFDMDLVKHVYEYAAKNNIHVIFNCGDFIEGAYASDNLLLKTTNEQVEYLIKKYPYDKDIRNYVIFGNHDYHSILYEGFDISKKIENSRFDMVSIGYGKGVVNMKSDSILLQHELSVVENPDIGRDNKIILAGHGHMMKTKCNGKFILCVPSLSYVSPDKKKEIVPGFIELSLNFDKKKIEYVEAKHLIVDNSVKEVSISKCKVKSLMEQNYIYNKKDKWK